MGTRRTPTAASVFAAEDDEEEERPARRLVPIEYTPEELAAASRDAFDPLRTPPGAADASASERAKSAAAAIEANIRRVAAESEAAARPRRRRPRGRFSRGEVNWSAYAEGNGRARAATGGKGPSVASPNFWGRRNPRWWNWCWRRRTSDCLPTRWSKRSNPCWTPRRNRSCWTFGASYSKRRGARLRVGTRRARRGGRRKTPSQDTQILIVTYSSVHHTDGLFVTWRRRTRNRERTTPPRMGADDPSSRLRPSSLRHPG